MTGITGTSRTTVQNVTEQTNGSLPPSIILNIFSSTKITMWNATPVTAPEISVLTPVTDVMNIPQIKSGRSTLKKVSQTSANVPAVTKARMSMIYG